MFNKFSNSDIGRSMWCCSWEYWGFSKCCIHASGCGFDLVRAAEILSSHLPSFTAAAAECRWQHIFFLLAWLRAVKLLFFCLFCLGFFLCFCCCGIMLKAWGIYLAKQKLPRGRQLILVELFNSSKKCCRAASFYIMSKSLMVKAKFADNGAVMFS